MKKLINIAFLIAVILLVIATVVGFPLAQFEMHKHSLEHMVGHPVSNWDAFFTK